MCGDQAQGHGHARGHGDWHGLCAQGHGGPLFIVEGTKFGFSRPRKLEPPVESSNFSGLEMERDRRSLGSGPRKMLELRPFLP